MRSTSRLARLSESWQRTRCPMCQGDLRSGSPAWEFERRTLSSAGVTVQLQCRRCQTHVAFLAGENDAGDWTLTLA